MTWRAAELVVHINSICCCPGSTVATLGSSVRVGAFEDIIIVMS